MKKLHILAITLLCLVSAEIAAQAISNPNKKSIITKYEDTKFDSSKSLSDNLASSKTTSYSAMLFKNPDISKKVAASKKTTVFVVSNKFFDKMKEGRRHVFS